MITFVKTLKTKIKAALVSVLMRCNRALGVETVREVVLPVGNAVEYFIDKTDAQAKNLLTGRYGVGTPHEEIMYAEGFRFYRELLTRNVARGSR